MSGLPNIFPAGNLYPSADSGAAASLGLRMGASSGFQGTPEKTAVQDQSPIPAAGPGGQKNVLIAGVVFVALLFVLMFTAKHLGEEGEFKNIKLSAYNALVIALAAIVGIPVFKFLFTKVQIPGLSAWVLAV